MIGVHHSSVLFKTLIVLGTGNSDKNSLLNAKDTGLRYFGRL
jgi:hypothetical protein